MAIKMNILCFSVVLWMIFCVAFGSISPTKLQNSTTVTLPAKSSANVNGTSAVTTNSLPAVGTTPTIDTPTKPAGLRVPTKPDIPTKPTAGNKTNPAAHSGTNKTATLTVDITSSTKQPATTSKGNVVKATPSNTNGNDNSTSQFNQLFQTLAKDFSSIIQNISGASNNGQNPGPGLQNLPEIAAFLGNFLPQDSQNILSEIAQNQSALTTENLMKLAGPLANALGTVVLAQNGVSQKCSDDFGVIVNGILAREQWALRMLDAMFKIPPNVFASVIGASPRLLGGYDECLAIEASTASGQHMQGQYCTAEAPIPIPNLLTQQPGSASIGLCVSMSCSASDIAIIVNSVAGQLVNQTEYYKFDVNCSKKKDWGTDMIVVTCFLSILGAMVFLSTLYDLCIASRRTRQTQYEKGSHNRPGGTANGHIQLQEHKNGISNGGYVAEAEVEKNKMDAAISETNVDSATGNGTVSLAMETKHPTIHHSSPSNVAERICLSFSIYSNGVKLLNTNQGAGSLGAVNGIRFLSMAWVILGHTYFFAMGYESNLLEFWGKNMEQWSFLAIAYASVSVDSFFALSGVLVAYLTLKELKKVGGASKMNWFMFYFHRFWRLTPPYMLVIMVGTVVLPYVVQGPMATNEDLVFMQTCRTDWWRNLLYINNYLYEDDKLCLGWSWYLANDMQMYIISPLLLLPFFYNAAAGLIVSAAFLIATIAASGVVAKNHEYPIQTFSQFAHLPKDGDYGHNIYTPSYARMGPYIIGLVTGYALYRCKRLKYRIPRAVNIVCWLLCVGITCACVYGPYTKGDSHIMSLWENTAFIALHRTGWGIAVCWIIFACATGNGGWIDEILSWKAFIPLGRLTYCAYLVHPLVMVVYYESRRVPAYFTHYETIYLFLSHLVMSYGVAFVTSLFFESPMMGLEKALLHKKK